MRMLLSPAPRASNPGALLLAALLLAGGPVVASVAMVSGCGGGGCGTGAPEVPAAELATQVLPQALAEATWPVRMADDAARAPFEAHPGWALLFQRDHGQALAAFSSDRGDGRGLARTHAELAALYRQAALLGARSAQNTYGDARAAEDPVEVDYLLGVAAALDGKPDLARAAFTALGDAGPEPLKQAAAGWQAWLAAGSAWPPDAALTAIPGAPGPVEPGQAPEVGSLPHFQLVERSAEQRTVEVGDPTSLYLLARWHEAAARQAAPADGEAIDLYLAPWRLPAERAPAPAAGNTAATTGSPTTAPPGAVSIDDAWLFGGFVLAPADLRFLAEASTEGVAAVTRHQADSPLAAAVAPAIVDGQVVPDRMLDQAAWLGQQLEARMAARAGSEQPFHEPFARLGMVAVLRAGMIVADANGQFRDAGVLRINALDRSVEAAADPVFLASVAAWDAGNRNALRAQELVHGLVRRYPPLQAARYSLDSLHIRTSRNAAPAAPVH